MDQIKLLWPDLVMPKLGGGEAYDRIRSIRPDIPLIFQTGHDPVSARIDRWTKQGLPVLRKPDPMDALIKMVDEQLARNARATG